MNRVHLLCALAFFGILQSDSLYWSRSQIIAILASLLLPALSKAP